MANETGIVMDDDATNVNGEDQSTQEVIDALTDGTESSEMQTAGEVAESAVPEHSADATVVSSEDPKPQPEAKKYDQAFVDRLTEIANNEKNSLEKRLREVEDERRKKVEKIEQLNNAIRHRATVTTAMNAVVGDGSYNRIYDLVQKAVDLQLQVEQFGELKKQFDDLQSSHKTVNAWYTDVNTKYLALKDDFANINKELEDTRSKLEEAIAAYNELYSRYENGETMRARMLKASIPQCLVEKDWFDAFFKELEAGLQQDPIFDPATLVFASLAELAVMERNPASACFEWKKQLSDIGLVVANYMHQMKSAEGDVVKMLRNFAMAFKESETISKMKIALKVPELGPDFNVEEVKHNKNGKAVAKILNWCIIDANGVYSKAIVE